ncbi:cell envelope integrity protein CreD [Rapidithrix thailandica]|uniref:Cell envelope integrity protein CreD n=1 Tax=Rapidithrix thailandica TaxID=413964 RepID=A0AAW9SFK2_9BACT
MNFKPPTFFEKANHWIKNSITIRLLTIGIMILLLLIPINMVEDLIRERMYRQQEAVQEISSIWADAQTIQGLVLTIPYHVYTKVYDDTSNPDKFRLVKSTEYAHFLPETLQIEGKISPEVRYRSIYEVVVYNSKLSLKGKISPPDFAQWGIDSANVIWRDAHICLGLSDLRGIQEDIQLQWNRQTFNFNPGVPSTDVIQSGISTKVPLRLTGNLKEFNFELILDLNGSSGLHFTPLGKETLVDVQSGWKDPSFTGAFLPDQRDINPSGFSAHWKVLHLNRPYPQSFRKSVSGIPSSQFGVNLLMPVDEYQKSTRSVKYGIMFITLTFMIFFFVQILKRIRIHPIQYIIVGLAICVFYTLLIALSEHISFQYSYLVSSIAIITMITAYSQTVLRSTKLTRLMALILLILYTFMYVIIQMQDYSLLIGSIGLFTVLAIVMYLSRKIDWYKWNENNHKA